MRIAGDRRGGRGRLGGAFRAPLCETLRESRAQAEPAGPGAWLVFSTSWGRVARMPIVFFSCAAPASRSSMHAATVFLEIEAVTDGGSSSKIRYGDAALLVSRTSRTMVHARSVGRTTASMRAES